MSEPRPADALPPGPLGRRAVALLVDLFWSSLAGGTLAVAIVNWSGRLARGSNSGIQGGTATLLALGLILVAQALWFVGFWSLRGGETPGQRSMRLRVVRLDGSPLDAATALRRYLGYLLNTLPLGLGWLAALIGDGRTLADRLAGTRTVDTSPLRGRQWRFEAERRAKAAAVRAAAPALPEPGAEAPGRTDGAAEPPGRDPAADDVARPAAASAWRTARVFISSTFRDMHAERDHLVRVVFPELRARCAERRLHLIDVDLRWGVTEAEAEQGRVLAICLDEIERSRPFFVGILGERYGWTPPAYTVPDEPAYDWLKSLAPGHSVTAVEVIAGVLRNPAMAGHAFFYFRDPLCLREVPAPADADFRAESDQAATRLAQLKAAIRAAGFPVHDGYPCRFGGLDAQGRARLVELEAFGGRVLDDLWAAISAEFPAETPAAEPLADERHYQVAFAEGRVRGFVGRSDLLARLEGYALGGPAAAAPLFVSGEPGLGKSALLARFATEFAARQPETFVLTHFVGVGPGSADPRRGLRRLGLELAARAGATEPLPDELNALRAVWPRLLERAAARGPVLLIVDALDQLDAPVAEAAAWLPVRLPPGARLIVSAAEGEVAAAWRRLADSSNELVVGPLARSERREIVRRTLGEYRKALDERPEADQLAALLAKAGAASPLYLAVACEELRVFGDFEGVSARIAALPETVPALFGQVLDRLAGDNGAELVRDALSLLAVARHGLFESELLELLRPAGEAQLPRATWARLYRGLQPYLRPPGESGADALDFFHRQLEVAVRTRYLSAPGAEAAAHGRLADYCRGRADPAGAGDWGGGYARGLSELPYHLGHAGRRPELAAVLTDLGYVAAAATAGLVFELVDELKAAAPLVLDTDLDDWARFVDSQSHILAAHPDLVLQQALNEPAGTAPARAAQARLARSGPPGPFLRWLSRPATEAPRDLLRTLAVDGGVVGLAVTPDTGTLLAAEVEQLRRWDFESGRETAAYPAEARYTCLALAGDGRTALLGRRDGTVVVWDVAGGRERRRLTGHEGEITAVAIAPDGQLGVSAAADDTLRVWQLATGEAERLIVQPGVSRLALTPTGRHVLAAGPRRRTLALLDLLAVRPVWQVEPYAESVWAVAVSPDGRHAVSAGDANLSAGTSRVLIWDLASGRPLGQPGGHFGAVLSATFSPDGAWLLLGSGEGAVRIVPFAVTGPVRTLTGHTAPVTHLATTSDGQQLVSAALDRTIRIWDWRRVAEAPSVATGSGRRVGGAIASLAVDPAGRRVYYAERSTNGPARPIRVWHAERGAEAGIVAGSRAETARLGLSSDGRRLAVAREDRDWWAALFPAEVWSVGEDTATARRLLSLSNRRFPPPPLAMSPDGRMLAVGWPRGAVRLYAVPDAAPSNPPGWLSRHGRRLGAHPANVVALVFSPDGRYVVSLGEERRLAVWAVERGERLADFPAGGGEFLRLRGRALRVTPDGRAIVAAGAGWLRVWSWDDWRELAAVDPAGTQLVALDLTADGRHAVTADSSRRLIRVWSLPELRPVAVYPADGSVTDVAALPDGRIYYGDDAGHLEVLRLEGV